MKELNNFWVRFNKMFCKFLKNFPEKEEKMFAKLQRVLSNIWEYFKGTDSTGARMKRQFTETKWHIYPPILLQ